MKRYIFFLWVSLLVFSSCEDLFEPAIENLKDLDLMYTDPVYAQGVLTNAYRFLPDSYRNTEYATDDAVTNNRNDRFLSMATGSWTASSNPVNMWNDGYGAMQYLNTFIERVDDIDWAEDQEAAELFNMRMKGEAYGLRGVFLYYLLQSHGGYSSSGELLGVPIITEVQDVNTDFNIPRASFQDCVDQILSDLDSAIVYLPMEYENVSEIDQVPDKYRNIVSLSSTYNRVMGNFSRQLLNAHIAMAYQSKVALLAASPAFQNSANTTTWADAAEYSANVLEAIDGISGLASNGVTYYDNREEINNLAEGVNPPEILWRQNVSTTSTQEENNFPPTLFGDGRMNPTQNLVEAFPDDDGYPIDHESSRYDPSDPFARRDPRLSQFIVFNGSSVEGTTIYTGSGSGTDDAINFRETSTRTGYYMKKRLRLDVRYNNADGSWQQQSHYTPRIRFTEMFLNYAEAANEAYGPVGIAPNAAYSAYDVIKAIRERAGVGLFNGDAYLESIKGDQDAMRELIRNERRIELCFEGFRFWDLRRWGVDLTVPAKGYDATTEEVFDVETRLYSDYMQYGPIPFSEVLKFDNLVQNRGWQ